ncbi:hypothetical protein FHR84_000813 [Actinopolyspora biskrensis]|uniref:Uncharacterized protein n=1 Tax=Actinopolyspora biskrensis TaxID=1470178 RepID=A0A852YVA2_9ACTN|nr:hypothetical protein [Actinopolyspora biskrensis]
MRERAAPVRDETDGRVLEELSPPHEPGEPRVTETGHNAKASFDQRHQLTVSGCFAALLSRAERPGRRVRHRRCGRRALRRAR